MPSPSDPPTLQLALDRIACTGHGVCASILPGQIGLDEWGYPVVHTSLESLADPSLGDAAIRLCPARALAWARNRTPTPTSTSKEPSR